MSTERKKILFVDDDASILSALSNVLRRDRERWDMVFAVGSEAALVELGRTTFDVVVSDMKMPGMDGVALLEAVRQSSPETARIMLSGSECDAEIEHAHELLAKPCSTRVLRELLERLTAR